MLYNHLMKTNNNSITLHALNSDKALLSSLLKLDDSFSLQEATFVELLDITDQENTGSCTNICR